MKKSMLMMAIISFSAVIYTHSGIQVILAARRVAQKACLMQALTLEARAHMKLHTQFLQVSSKVREHITEQYMLAQNSQIPDLEEHEVLLHAMQKRAHRVNASMIMAYLQNLQIGPLIDLHQATTESHACLRKDFSICPKYYDPISQLDVYIAMACRIERLSEIAKNIVYKA